MRYYKTLIIHGFEKEVNDYPVRAMWNPTLAVIVFQHESIEKLCRKLSHNGQLREVCGFEGQVPPSYAYRDF
ncbi:MULTISPECIES: transposase [Heyndrickxia]|uniref:transposase n=1 Tax=Heyndrickxia coagulans TaxID=1398 RepID=UPI0022858A9A|nr:MULTISPECIES: transposase [Heyndrickxia]MEC2304891.1 transposase [Weizmannia sp. CD-2023]MEC2341502.1 transposase [Weizmannia sp. CD-2023]MEC5269236.1 transposase [Heyndrickxia coagulans]MED4345093.1 transposase [Heyndrickxia coagulans]MED4891464.1 transposase [Weizmannia sp. CD-2023]